MGETCNTHERNRIIHNTVVGKPEARMSAILNLTRDESI